MCVCVCVCVMAARHMRPLWPLPWLPVAPLLPLAGKQCCAVAQELGLLPRMTPGVQCMHCLQSRISRAHPSAPPWRVCNAQPIYLRALYHNLRQVSIGRPLQRVPQSIVRMQIFYTAFKIVHRAQPVAKCGSTLDVRQQAATSCCPLCACSSSSVCSRAGGKQSIYDMSNLCLVHSPSHYLSGSARCAVGAEGSCNPPQEACTQPAFCLCRCSRMCSQSRSLSCSSRQDQPRKTSWLPQSWSA